MVFDPWFSCPYLFTLSPHTEPHSTDLSQRFPGSELDGMIVWSRHAGSGMSLKNNDWWPPFIRRLQKESLADLCLEFGLIEEAVIPELIEESRGRPLIEAIWWEEARRQVDSGESIRFVARRFGTHFRRMRKAMARSGGRNRKNAPASPQLMPPRVERIEPLSEEPRQPQSKPRRPLTTSLPKRAEEEVPEISSRRRRRGRLRLVRPEHTDERAPEPEVPSRSPRKLKSSPHSKVRVIDVDDVDLSELLVEPPAPPRAAPEPPALRVVEPTPAEPSVIAFAPAVEAEPVAVALSIARPDDAVLADLEPRSAARAQHESAWRVRVDGAEQPLVVVAADILQAAEMFAARLGVDALRRADIYAVPLL